MLTWVEDDYNLEVTSRLARTKLAPLYFVRSGYISPSTGFSHAGYGGDYRSSRAATYESNILATTIYFAFNNINTITSNGPYGRFYGFPLRCLSTVLDM